MSTTTIKRGGNMTFEQKYPEAYEDECGTVWVSKAAADAGKVEFDSDFANGDAFLNDVLGWSMAEAIENLAECEKIARRKAFWGTHPRLHDTCWFILRHYRFTSMFLGIVWRDWHGRISWSLAWKLAGDLWLR